ncbi:MAG: sulfatase [Bacteroidota bacterium]
MKLFLLSFLCLLVYLLPFPSQAQETNDYPNVVFIMVDDLGWKDTGFMGGSFFHTPHIDHLASESLIFTQAYAGAANCAPSRACLFTGQQTSRHGILTVGPSERGKAETRKLIPIENTDTLSNEQFTFIHLFKERGYQTASIGKWHLSESPELQGFDINIAGSRRGNPGKNGYFSPYHVKPLQDGPEGEHLTDRLTSEAISFMRENKDQPFFLYLPYYAVHTPLEAKDRLIAKYQQKKQNESSDIHPVYAAMVENTDWNIGRLLNTLDSLNLSQSTLVIFTSDNGGIASISSQAPLRAGKGSYYEGGIRIPLTMRWPEKFSPRRITQPVSFLDFFPTFSDLLDLPIKDYEIDGLSLFRSTEGDMLAERTLFWHFPIYLQAYDGEKDQSRDPLFRTRPGSVIRKGKWKLHHYVEDDAYELYDLITDPGEWKNLAGEFPDKLKELQTFMEEYRTKVHAHPF